MVWIHCLTFMMEASITVNGSSLKLTFLTSILTFRIIILLTVHEGSETIKNRKNKIYMKRSYIILLFSYLYYLILIPYTLLIRS